MNTFDHTVHATSGSAAAATRSTPSGTGISCPAGTATWVGVRTRGQQRAGRVADRPAVDVGAERRDGSAALHAENGGRPRRRRVVALPLQQVGAVERRPRPRASSTSPGAGLGVGEVANDEDLGATGPLSENSTHPHRLRRPGSQLRPPSRARRV